MSHTPGPWKITGDLIVGDMFLVADPFVGENKEHPPEHFPEYAANARLIAAAPDLLAACKAFIEDWEKPMSSMGVRFRGTTIEKIEAAIAKAKGTP